MKAAAILPWIRAARPAAHGMIALPLLFGQAIALRVSGQFHPEWFLVIHLFGLLLQVYVLYLNDYADEALDRTNRTYWLSGGSRVIPDGQLTGRQLYRAAFLPLFAMLGLSLAGLAGERPGFPGLVALALLLGWSYSLPPLRSAYRGLGELHQALACGILLPLGGYYLQTGSLALFPWPFLLPVALLFYAMNIVTALPDAPSDRAGGKLTYPVRNGAREARRNAVLFLAISYIVAGYVSRSWLPVPLMAGLACLPALLMLLALCRREREAGAGLRWFVLVTTASPAWLLTAWTALMFWRGPHHA